MKLYLINGVFLMSKSLLFVAIVPLLLADQLQAEENLRIVTRLPKKIEMSKRATAHLEATNPASTTSSLINEVERLRDPLNSIPEPSSNSAKSEEVRSNDSKSTDIVVLVGNSQRNSMQDRIPGGFDVYVFGEYLYLKACGEGLDYASSTALVEPGVLSGPLNISKKRIDPKYHSAGRFGVGVNSRNNDTSAQIMWMGFSNTTSSHTKGNLRPLNSALFPAYAAAAKAEWKIDLDMIDLQVDQKLYVGNHFKARPFIGFRTAWGEQDFNISADYTGARDITGNLYSEGVINCVNHQKYVGVGPEIGADLHWNVVGDFFLSGRGLVSLLFSHYDVSHRTLNPDKVKSSNVLLPNLPNSTKDHVRVVQPVFEVGVSAYWKRFFGGDKYYVKAELGWEHQNWSKHNQFIEVGNNDVNNQGDFSLSGLKVGLQIGF